MKNKIKKTTMWFISIVLGYLGLGLIAHHFIFPLKTPDYKTYFKIGSSFNSEMEGLKQTIVKLEGGLLTTDIEIKPHSNGPIEHLHENFDETFYVKSGTLSMQYNSSIKKLQKGQSIIIPKNTVHRPFNESDSTVTITSVMPADFAYCLSQIYPFWDKDIANTKPPKILFQLSIYGDKFDSYPTKDAPPKPVIKILKYIMAPTTRLLGYQLFDPMNTPR